MKFKDVCKQAKEKILIVGINPLISEIEMSAKFFADLLTLETSLIITILYESDTESFNQSLCLDTRNKSVQERVSYEKMKTHRRRLSGSDPDRGLKEEIGEYVDSERKEGVLARVKVFQVNVRIPANLLFVDESLYYSITSNRLPNEEDYQKLASKTKQYSDFVNYTESLLSGTFLSKPSDELIWVYDKTGIPRCIAPRSSFYTTEFQRRSIWGFVFNRKGDLLLQQRSKHTKDNRLLWDKSIGGHVDLTDSSSSITAKRELIEELFLPEAEFTKYLKEDLGDIIDFGDWNPVKRPERHFSNALDVLSPSDWVMFRATDNDGIPLTVTRVSSRKINVDGGVVSRKTVFSSDVYLFIAPEDYMDTEEQMKELVSLSEKKGASSDHKLVTLTELKDWMEKEEDKGIDKEMFTDDLLHINIEYFDMLENFSEFLKYIGKKII